MLIKHRVYKTHQMVHTTFNGFTKCERLAEASHDDDDLACFENGGDTDGERHAWDSGDVTVEEPGIGEDRIICQRFDTRT